MPKILSGMISSLLYLKARELDSYHHLETHFSKSGNPHFLLLAGYEPGVYTIEVRHRITDVLLFKDKFEITSLWEEEMEGPSFWFTGIEGTYTSGSAWGGGPSDPQNTNVIPAIGTRRIAVLLVDTSSQRFTTDGPTLQGFRDRWMNELINGVTQGGITRSVRSYFREV
ncbi:MAG: hypothetical protein ACRD39_04660 [Nitrososphaeraceae archaeon]